MYHCKHFKLHELVSEKLYREYEGKGKLDFLWLLFDERALMTIDKIRERHGACIINNWFYWHGVGEKFEYSGLRQKCDPFYKETSQHAYGRAFDVKAKHVDPETIRNDIRENHKTVYPFITGIEKDVSWVHLDVGNRGSYIEF